MNRADRRKTAKTNKERIDEYVQEGQSMMVPGGDLRQAQRLFRQVLALDPGDAQANLHLGVMEMWTRNYQKAQELFTRAYESDPRNPQIMNNLGLSMHEQGAIPEAMNLYDQALQIDPNNAEAHVNFARGLLQVNERDRALAEARQAVALRPEMGTAHFILGTICQVMGLEEEARGSLQKAVDLIPGHTEANFRLARLSYDPENPETYLEPARKAFEANSDNLDAAITYSEILFGAKKFDEAESILSTFAQGDDRSVQQLGVFNGMAHAKASKDDFEGAIEYHKKAYTITVDDPNSRFFHGRTLLWSGDYHGASEQFQKSIRGLPFNQDLIGMLALTQKLEGKTEASKIEVENLVKQEFLAPREAYASIDELNKAILAKLEAEPPTDVHPFDARRRIGKKSWEAVLGRQHLEPIVALSDPMQELMTGFVADMPDGVNTHPLLARKQYGLGPSGSHAESITKTEAFDYALDPQGWFKIVYFLNTPEEVEDETKKAGWLRIGMPHFKNDFGLTPDIEIKPESGKAVILPAYHWHGFNALDAKSPLTFITVVVNAAVG